METACLEANDNVRFLKPLRKYFEKLNGMDDFTGGQLLTCSAGWQWQVHD